MPETVVVCGETAKVHGPAPALYLDVDAPPGHPERVNLNIGQITRRMVSDLSDRLVDLLEIAAYVYAADQFVSRGGRVLLAMGSAWRREFLFKIPVRDASFWQRKETLRTLVEALSFLTDDYFAFSFRPAVKPRQLSSYLNLDSDAGPVGFDPDRVVLFSGGLDSLAGAASALMVGTERLALVSHHASSMIWSRQTELISGLRRRLPPGRIFHVGVTVTKGQEEASEFTQRSRSFLFACLALVVARLLGKTDFTFFENGIVSLNLPIAAHVLGTRATRTTHPKVLSDFGRLFSQVSGSEIRIHNPYFWNTKAEVLGKIADAGCGDLIARSFSCSHVRLATKRGQQCGICTQCLDRRFAVLAAGLEGQDPADGYAVDLLQGERESGPELTLAESFVVAALRYVSMTQTAFFARYGQVFRALPYLSGDIGNDASRIFELHQRHGHSIEGVIQRAKSGLSLETALALPPTCLLSLIQSSFGSPAVVRDPIEDENPNDLLARASTGPSQVARPIGFSVDANEKQVLLADHIVVRGVAFRLIQVLLNPFLADLGAGTPPSRFAFTATSKIADAMGTDFPGVRQIVIRCRRNIVRRFLDQLNAAVASDDVIESNSWKGYRLNPFLQLRRPVAAAELQKTKQDVTPLNAMSRLGE